ncbi:phosphotransferase enzyme family protein [Arthrobacter sp. ISL-28]|uniref:phosphotransferase enzyme family protein n=1 Tax=Arthrobacter sp. ISL-28 TaxID=2819108 RepID=UPI001BE70DAF|nr:phosphotransferase [Arthrobacter sp. ISL-28]MBT2522553.1 phosphotransferase [Arthrobacter sp. ISL-28]
MSSENQTLSLLFMTSSFPASTDLVREALSHFGIDAGARITFIKQRENQVFRVESDGQDFAVRIHRPGYRTAEEIECEAHHLRALRDAQLLVPDPVESEFGVFALPVGSNQQLVSVQRWLPGALPIADSFEVFTGTGSLDERHVSELGSVMARHHLHAESAPTRKDFSRPAWDADGLFGPRALWGDAAGLRTLTPEDRLVLSEAVSAASLKIQALGKDPSVFGPIHADMTFENVLATDEGLAIIDFDDFGEGWFAFDIATALFFATPSPQYPALERAFLEGYQQVRRLEASVLAAMDAFLLARGLTYLGWAADRPENPASEFAAAQLCPWVMSAAKKYALSGSTGWTSYQYSTNLAQGELR